MQINREFSQESVYSEPYLRENVGYVFDNLSDRIINSRTEHPLTGERVDFLIAGTPDRQGLHLLTSQGEELKCFLVYPPSDQEFMTLSPHANEFSVPMSRVDLQTKLPMGLMLSDEDLLVAKEAFNLVKVEMSRAAMNAGKSNSKLGGKIVGSFYDWDAA